MLLLTTLLLGEIQHYVLRRYVTWKQRCNLLNQPIIDSLTLRRAVVATVAEAGRHLCPSQLTPPS
jgi:hypothetical protein